MAETQPTGNAKRLLAAALDACGIKMDDERLAHLEPMVDSLLADAAALTPLAKPETEPWLVARLPGAERADG